MVLDSSHPLYVFISFEKLQLPFKGQTVNQATSPYWHFFIDLAVADINDLGICGIPERYNVHFYLSTKSISTQRANFVYFMCSVM